MKSVNRSIRINRMVPLVDISTQMYNDVWLDVRFLTGRQTNFIFNLIYTDIEFLVKGLNL